MARRNQQLSITAVCVPNIGAKGRRRRLIGGIGWSLATGAVYTVFVSRGAPPAMFLVVAPFVAIAALHFFQVKEET
jgi:hypothetical protein